MKDLSAVIKFFGLVSFCANFGTGDDVDSEVEDFSCCIYVAESSVPNAGQGVFTLCPYKKDEVVGEPEANILCNDIEAHNGGKVPKWPHLNYFWNPEWHPEYLSARGIHANAFPLGALSNFHTYFKNLYPGDVPFNKANVSRFDSPGAGAFSYFTRVFTATRDIEAGEEIFANYGEFWLDDHHFDDIPREKNFKRAEIITGELHSLVESLGTELDEKYINTIKNIVKLYDQRTSNILPSNNEELGKSDSSTIAKQTLNIRTPEWIKANGQCLDTIAVKESLIPHAGLGAFAKKSFKKGELIVPMPLLQIVDKTTLKILDFAKGAKKDSVITQQLLLNYCFGRDDSKLILCPTTHGSFINHKSTSSDGEDSPNSKFEWTNTDTVREWLKKPLTELEDHKKRGLSFDIVATKDIKAGEEIYMDYGPEWVAAWNEHVENWEPPHESRDEYVYPNEMNEQNEDEIFRTVYEQVTEPYPNNIMTICTYWEDDEHEVKYDETMLYEDKVIIPIEELQKVVTAYSIDGRNFVQDKDELYWPCQVLHRSEDGSYIVRINQNLSEKTTKWTIDKTPRIFHRFSSQSIIFADKPYVSDQFLIKAFRHVIGIPDEMFPDIWKEIASLEDDST